MAQAAVSDSEFLDLLPPFDDGPAAPEVDVGGREIAEAFMVSAVVVMLDEGVDLTFKVPATKRGDDFLATQTFKDNANLLFRRILLARLAPDVPNGLLGRGLLDHGFLSHLRSLRSLR